VKTPAFVVDPVTIPLRVAIPAWTWTLVRIVEVEVWRLSREITHMFGHKPTEFFLDKATEDLAAEN
jgi:hypothetical protein